MRTTILHCRDWDTAAIHLTIRTARLRKLRLLWPSGAITPTPIFSSWTSQLGLALNATRILLGGAQTCGDPPKAQCDAEATADLEYSTAMANSFGAASATAAVYEYEGLNGDSMEDVLNQILTDHKVRVINMSWGIAENELSSSELTSFHAVFRALVGAGITPVAASGDGGATSGCGASVTVSYPASDPYVVAVGGTSLDTSSNGYSGETAWQGNSTPGIV